MKRMSRFDVAKAAEVEAIPLMCNKGVQNARRIALAMYHYLKDEEKRHKAKDIAEGLSKPKKCRRSKCKRKNSMV